MKIERKVAEQLVDSLSCHAGIIPVDKIKFVELLTSIDIPISRKFYVDLSDDDKCKQLLQETRRYHYLSIRRVLINKNVDYRVSLVKKIWGKIISKIGRAWPSNVFSRNLRLNAKIAKILAESKSPYSLLVKFETYDYDNQDEVMFVISKPILAVSTNINQDDIEIITEWERANTKYEKEVGFSPVKYLKRISFKKYIAHS